MICLISLNPCSIEEILDVFSISIGCWPSSHPTFTCGSGSRILEHGLGSLQVKPRGSGWSLACQACWLPSLSGSIRENCTHKAGRPAFPCVQDAWNVSSAGAEACRGPWVKAKCSGGFWANIRGREIIELWSMVSGMSVQEGTVRSHCQEKVYIFQSFSLHLIFCFKRK